ncbi:MAG: hypothetical protein M3O87_00915, partial [Candidatus Dormibacteraeota bacterium]|nr:hypothetical protein [Candidatus Dormibacteraeota bacterium]
MTRFEALRAAAIVAVEVAAIVLVSVRLQSKVADPDDGLPLRWLIGLVLAAAQVIGVALLLGAATILRPETVLLAHLLLAGVVLVAVRPTARLRPHRLGGGDALALSLGLSLATVAALAELRGPSFSFDTSWYHIVNAAEWLKTGSTWSVPFSVPGTFLSFYPGSSDLVGTWLMLSTHQDQLAYLPPVAFGALLVLATAVVASELGAPAWLGALAGLALVASPLTWQFQAHSLMSDLPATAAVVAAIALILRGARQPDGMAWPLLAGAALGIGIGSKYTAWIPSILVLGVVLALFPRGRRLRSLSLAVAGSAALGGFWLLRNLVVTANPIFPGGVRIAGVQVFPAGHSTYQDTLVSLVHWIVRGDQPMLTQLVGW